jgi:hypothetical protein
MKETVADKLFDRIYGILSFEANEIKPAKKRALPTEILVPAIELILIIGVHIGFAIKEAHERKVFMDNLRREILKHSAQDTVAKLDQKKDAIIYDITMKLKDSGFDDELTQQMGKKIFEDTRRIIQEEEK